MSFWWVSQNKSYVHEKAGGYLWAPTSASDGNFFYHWKNMTRLSAGDVIFSYVGKRIVAVVVATSAGYKAQRPAGLGGETWQVDGNQVDAVYCELNEPIEVQAILSDLTPLLPVKYSPIDKNGDGVYGYLFEVPPTAGALILTKIVNHSAG